jgi:putative FmdB family regulatory protein
MNRLYLLDLTTDVSYNLVVILRGGKSDMPIYEYKCQKCHRRFSVFCKISERINHPKCEFCSSEQTDLLVSRFKTVRSEEQIMESFADPSSLSGLDENDPRSIAKWAKKMAKEMGEDMGDEIEAMAEEEIAKGPNAFQDPSGGLGDESGIPPMPPTGSGFPLPED